MYESPGQPWILDSTLWIPDCVAEKRSVFSVREALFVSFSLSMPECWEEFCKVTLTFESVDEIL